MVLLASRPYGGYYRNLGRETFIVPVDWEDDWPIISPSTGKIEISYEKPDLEKYTFEREPSKDNFNNENLVISGILFEILIIKMESYTKERVAKFKTIRTKNNGK